ncbi:MAG: GC-type dockerin domain-anchored protein [Phycisphaerales bacterium]|nr:GC-type dockerin domain-anchored protein [Phycisphaerales bacterium]
MCCRHSFTKHRDLALITAAALAAAAGAPASLRAQPIAFDNTCGNGLWHHWCEGANECESHNNWNTGFTTQCQTNPPAPGPSNDVSLGNFVVINNTASPIRSLTTNAHFINRHVVTVSQTAVYNGPVTVEGHFFGGSHFFNQLVTVPATGANSPEWGQGYHYLHGGLVIDAGVSVFMDGDISNSASTTWHGDDTFYIDSAYAPLPGPPGGIFRNLAGATFLATGNGQMHGLIGLGHFLNSGTFTKEGGGGTTTISSRFVNTGSVHVSTGTLRLNGPSSPPSSFGGTITVDAGSLLEFYTGTTQLNNMSSAGDGMIRVVGATIELPAGTTSTLRHLDMDSARDGAGTLIVTHSVGLGGTHEGGGLTQIAPGCTGVIDNSYTNYDGPVHNGGTLTWTAGFIGLSATAPFTNTATGIFEVRCDNLPLAGAGFTSAVFTNHGRFGKYAGPGDTTVSLAAFNNYGTVEAASGTLSFPGGFNQHVGVTRLAGGAFAGTYAEYELRFHGGVLTGYGQIKGHVRNLGGTVRPGNSAGTITLSQGSSNGYIQEAGGTLEVEIGGTSPGTEYDRLVIDGGATLAGTLRVLRTNGFTGDGNFDIITFGFPGLTGEFTTLDAPPGTTVQYLADRVRVVFSSCSADLGMQGGAQGQDGVLDNNDFIVFIDHLFNQDPRADVGRQGGVAPGEGIFDNNDFVVFIDAFFSGCS